MKKWRIISNGEDYVVQTRRWWFPIWLTLKKDYGYFGEGTAYFKTAAEAEQAAREYAEPRRWWQVVN